MKAKQHIEGWITIDENLEIADTKLEKDWYYGSKELATIISDNFYEQFPKDYESQLSNSGEYDYEMGGISLFIPNCNLSFYTSDNKISLEEIEERQLTQLIGGIDIYGENYGYSSWTILGFDVQNMTIGNHDLNSILGTYKDKYIHIIIEYEVKEGDS